MNDLSREATGLSWQRQRQHDRDPYQVYKTSQQVQRGDPQLSINCCSLRCHPTYTDRQMLEINGVTEPFCRKYKSPKIVIGGAEEMSTSATGSGRELHQFAGRSPIGAVHLCRSSSVETRGGLRSCAGSACAMFPTY